VAALDDLERSEQTLLASERMSTLGRFTSGMAHDLRNNLTVMMNVLELVKHGGAQPAVLRAAEQAYQTLDALLSIVGDVNALARGDLYTAKRSSVAIAAFLEDTLAAFRADPAGRGRAVVSSVQQGATGLVFDPVRMRQALLALLRHLSCVTPQHAAIEVVADGRAGAGGVFRVSGRLRADAPGAEHVATPEGSPTPSGVPSAVLGVGLEIARVVAEAHGGSVAITRSDDSVTAVLSLPESAEARVA